MLKVENVSGGYDGETIVKDIHFSVGKGEFFGILGPNGSGKTTLLKMMSGLLELEQGEVKIDDRSISDLTKNSSRKRWLSCPNYHRRFFRIQ